MVHVNDLEFEVPAEDTTLVLTEGEFALTVPEEDPDTFVVPFEDNLFVVERWS